MAEQIHGRWADYEARLIRVLEYIHDHLDDELNLNRIAEVACFSPYHWHRIYAGVFGEPVAVTVRRLRMHHAAGRLIRTEMPVREIAQASGFNGVQSFTRAFRSAFGVPPAEYRKESCDSMYDVKIQTLPEASALTCEHTGSYMKIGRAFDRLHAWLVTHDSISQPVRLIALYYDDPAAVPEEQLRSRAGFIAPNGISSETPFDRTAIRGGKYAVLRHKGPYAELARAYEWLYGQWLPQSGQEPADAPAFEEYINTPQNTAPAELLTDICLPLR